MIVGGMMRNSRILSALLVIVVTGTLTVGMGTLPALTSHAAAADSDSGSSPSVTCIALGLYGDITTPVLMDRLSDSGDILTFAGTSNGLYVVAPDGQLQHFLYSPFGIRHIALIDDITGDGTREVVVALDDTLVPALRCYDGATWERLWQFAPVAKIWDRKWADRQLIITNLETIDNAGSQSLLITFGRCVSSVNPQDGCENWRFTASSAMWRMAALADLNGDDVDDVFAGSDDGHLYMLSGKNGELRWRTKLPRHKGVDYNGITHLVSDIAVLDEESGKVVVVSAECRAQMYDLVDKELEWETLAFEEAVTMYYSSEDILISLTPDISDDGLPEVLLTKGFGSNESQARYAGYSDGQAALCDSSGTRVWENLEFECSPMGVQTSSIQGRPVFFQPGIEEITLVDLKDGESIVQTIPLSGLIDPGLVVGQPEGDGYLAFSSTSDLAAISAKGELLWCYPRVGKVTSVDRDFVGDSTSDVLLYAESSRYGNVQTAAKSGEGMTIGADPSAGEPGVRVLRMMDGATRETAWSYEVPHSQLKSIGGLKGTQVGPDLVGSDGIQDIISYSEDTVFIFSGKDGRLVTLRVGQPIASLDVIRAGTSGSLLAASIDGGLIVLDSAGTQLWTTTSVEWTDDESGSFMVVEDINDDNVSDLVVISARKIVVLESVGATASYELHLAFNAETDSSIEYIEAVPDADGDGVSDLACIQRRPQTEQNVLPWPPALMELSLVDGDVLFSVQLSYLLPAVDLACGDLNGDGCADSLVSSSEAGLVNLSVLSGRDGHLLALYSALGTTYRGLDGAWDSKRPPAATIGDMNGDGIDDLLYSRGDESKLVLHDVAHGTILDTIRLAPRLDETGIRYYSGGIATTILQADIDTDGHPEAVAETSEPWIPSYDPDADISYPGSSQSPRYLAVADVDSGRRLASFRGFDAAAISLFASHQPGVLGVAGNGGAYFLNVNSHLEITSPENGARTRPTVRVAWEGSTDGDFSQVYVSRVRNSMTNGSEVELYLAQGLHGLVVRSVDDCGRVSYSPSDVDDSLAIMVTPSPWKPVWLVACLSLLLVISFAMFFARLHRIWRGRKRAVK
jgi:outer membrane protein assembly factor BamB